MSKINLEYFKQFPLVVLTGVGKSKRIAQVICDSYQSLGYKFLFLDPTDLLHGSLGVFSSFSKALLILLSKSGTTKEIHDLSDKTKAAYPEVSQLLITMNESLYFSNGMKQVLFQETQEIDSQQVFPSYSLVQYLIFFFEILREHFDKQSIDSFLRNHPNGGLHQLLTQNNSFVVQNEEEEKLTQ